MNIRKIIKLVLCLGLWIQAASVLANSATTDTDADTNVKGPNQLTISYSDQFGLLADWKWVNYINPINAFGFELAFGGDFRLGGTWGRALTEQQRVKLTAEHYAQQFTMNFLTGSPTQWVGQNDVGLAYQYLILGNPWLKSVDAGAYYTNAESENVGTVPFVINHTKFIETRDFSGASTGNIHAGVTVRPWSSSSLGFSLDYDRVHYYPHFVHGENRSGIGEAVTFEQLLTSYLKFDLLASHTQPFDLYQAGIGWLLPSRPGTRLELTLAGSHLTGDIFTGTDNRAMLGIGYSWGGGSANCPRAHYDVDHDSLSQWTTTPAVHMPAVLIMKDPGIRVAN